MIPLSTAVEKAKTEDSEHSAQDHLRNINASEEIIVLTVSLNHPANLRQEHVIDLISRLQSLLKQCTKRLSLDFSATSCHFLFILLGHK